MKQKFTDPRLVALNHDAGFADDGMRRALGEALDVGEVAVATYSVSAHIWVQAVLTDRALLLVKGAVRARVTRVPLPLEIARAPKGTSTGVRVLTPLGKKTLWGSKLDPESALLLAANASAADAAEPAGEPRMSRRARKQARRDAGPRPRKPRRRRVRKQRVGFAPPSTIWELADNCVKCGRPLTDPRSRQARVGTKCIQLYGSQQRRIPNPAHAAWTDRKAKADVAYVAEKVQADADYERARAAYEQARAEWIRVRAS